MMGISRKAKSANFILLAMLFSSCAKIQINTPSSRFISPEANGKLFSGSVRGSTYKGTEGTVDFSEDKTDNPLELRNNVTGLGVDLSLGFIDRLDFLLRSSANAPSIYTLKYQILGAPRLEAKKGNQSLAVTFGYAQQEETQSESDTSVFNDSDDSIEADITQKLVDLSLIYGYRPSDDTLVYGSLQLTQHDVDFKITDSDSSSLTGEKFSINSATYGLALGATRYFNKFYSTLEVSAQRTNWSNNDPVTYGYLSFAFGFKWD